MRVPFADLARSTSVIRDELDRAMARVLDSGWYVLGQEGREFEQEFSAYVGTDHAVGVGSGTDAIELALRALDVGPGHDVVTQANTCVPTVSGIERAGARPVLCDVEPAGLTMDPRSLEAAITPATRAIIPVHLYGQCGDMDAILSIAGERGISVVEDCAQAHGATFRERGAGSMGAAGAFSFYPTKNLGALGDGGVVTTGDDGLAERLLLVRQYGQTERYRHEARGVNSRLDELQAAVLRAKLDRLEADNARRREIAAAYDDALAHGTVTPLARLADRASVFHLYVVRAPNRAALERALAEQGVATLIHYPRAVHQHAPYRELQTGVPLRNAEEAAEEVLSLPMFPELSDAEVEHVASVLRSVSASA